MLSSIKCKARENNCDLRWNYSGFDAEFTPVCDDRILENRLSLGFPIGVGVLICDL